MFIAKMTCHREETKGRRGDPVGSLGFAHWIASSLALLAMTASAPLHALNIEQFRLVFDGNGLVNLSDSQMLEKKGWSASAGLSYSHNPLQVETAPGVVQPVINYHVSLPLSAAYGLHDRISAGLSLPFFPTLSVRPVGSASSSTDNAIGDITLHGKIHLWGREQENLGQGLAVLPYVTLSTGSGANFTRDETATGGFRAAYDAKFKKNKVVANMGVRFRKEENLGGLDVGNEFLFGVGYIRPVWEEQRLSVLTELTGSTTFNNFLSKSNQTPLEWIFAAKKDYRPRGVGQMFLRAGVSVGLGSGYGTPDFRLFSTVNLQMKPRPHGQPIVEEKIEDLALVEGGHIVIIRPIHFYTAQARLMLDSLPVIKSIAELLKSQPHIRRVEVIGHTDHRGSLAYNLDLSHRRASAVVAKLTEYGIEAERLVAVGRGKSQPVAVGSDAEAMEKNRRVEFNIVEVRQGLPPLPL